MTRLQLFTVGIVRSHYDESFRSHRKLSLSIMKRFGFDQRAMETRILMEVEEMINKVREKQGRPFDVKQLTMSCMSNVIMSVAFGRRFDHSDPAFHQFVSDVDDLNDCTSPALMMFPVLRFLPHFKKIKVESKSVNLRILRFVNSNIAACTKVCNCSLLSSSDVFYEMYRLQYLLLLCFYLQKNRIKIIM